jgi:Sulfotransferase domain
MVVLCDGMVRSGSTWSFNVARELIRRSDPHHTTLGFFNEDPAVLSAAIRQRSSHLVIKCHTLDPSAYEPCCAGAVRAIYTWRHPYDAIASCIGMFGNSTRHWIGALRNALRVWSFHRTTGSACIVSYASITRTPLSSINSIASYLGLHVEPEQVRQIAEATSLEKLKNFSRQIEGLETSRLIRKDGYFYDRHTLLHHNHIRDGRIGHGAGLLSAEELSAIDILLRDEGFEFLCQTHGGGGLDFTAYGPAGAIPDQSLRLPRF